MDQTNFVLIFERMTQETTDFFFPKKDTTLVLENAIRLNVQDIPQIP